jgi:hypothetical protein
MDPRLQQILVRQQDAGFPDLQGAEASIVLPVSDRLLNQILSEGITLPSQVRELQVHAQAGNRVAVRVKVGGSFFPAINLTLVIVGQPELPAVPVLVLKLEMGGLLALAGPALRFLDSLPPGIRIEGDRVHVDLRQLAEARGLQGWLTHLAAVRVDTTEGALVLTLRAALRGTGTT